MANSYTVLANLRAGRCSNTAEVRLLCFWDAKNIKGGKLISLEMLLIDEESTLVQGTVPAALSLTFRERLSEGSIYTLSGFDVTRSSPKYRLSDGPIAIRFNEGTAFEKLPTTTKVLPTEHFRFQPYDHMLELANTGKQLPDVMGELRAIRSTITDSLPGPPRVMLTLRMEGDVNVVVSVFDSLAFAFHSKLDGYGREPRIVLVTGINPKIFSGKLYLNGTSAIRVFFDCETAVGKIAFERQTKESLHQRWSAAQKIESTTLAELNQFVLTGDPQINGIASFTGFDEEIGKLTHVLASEAAQIVVRAVAHQFLCPWGIGVNAQVDKELPRSLAPVVGNTYTFQLKLKDFNFTPNHQTFTISCIYLAPELAPTPTFVEVDDNAAPELEGSAVVGDASPGTLKSTIAEHSSSSGGPLEGREPADEEATGLKESARKKARVE
ncbi:Rep_fac-A_C domain-containing protein [Raphanus sativus]|nr:Rep_fac-A_C domain-containing protein [Raphanus sativus]